MEDMLQDRKLVIEKESKYHGYQTIFFYEWEFSLV